MFTSFKTDIQNNSSQIVNLNMFRNVTFILLLIISCFVSFSQNKGFPNVFHGKKLLNLSRAQICTSVSLLTCFQLTVPAAYASPIMQTTLM